MNGMLDDQESLAPKALGQRRSVRPRRVDAMDQAILTALSRDARQSVTSIAEQLHLSRANAYDRIARLRSSGVLKGYTAVIDPRAAGLETAAYVFVTLKQDDWEVLRRALAEDPAVRHLALVGGQYDAVLLVRTSSVEELRRVIFERIQSLNCVQATQTALIFDDHTQQIHMSPDDDGP
ncbi:MAG: Lrp/AsnC family transcriptional regulator [Nesterenkonia sp.]